MFGNEANRWWRGGVVVAWPLSRAVFRVRCEGSERIPSQGSAVLAFGHVSVLDGPLLAIEVMHRAHRQTRFLVASEPFATPIVGPILRRYDQIAIHRGRGDDRALEEAVRSLHDGALLAVAPEGHVNERPEDGLQRVRTGVARIALASAAPLLPVGIWGTQVRWGHGGMRLGRPIRPLVGLAVGAPILPVGDVADPEQVAAFASRVTEALADQMDRAKALARGSTVIRSAAGVSPPRHPSV